jgi:dethiobiotin synthetase
VPLLGVVVGAWPAEPGLAELENLTDLPAVTGAPMWGRIPEGAGRMTSDAFTAAVPGWFDIS